MSLRSALREHWPEYLIEAWALGCFMISIGVFVTIFVSPMSPTYAWVPSLTLRAVMLGLALGTTTIVLIHSPWGKRSGAHMNPAVTLAFLRARKIHPWDALFYVIAQTLGGILGVILVAFFVGRVFTDPPVNYAATLPGPWGAGVAFVAEAAISFVLMMTVLIFTASTRLTRYTGVAIGCLVALFIAVEFPLSGASMNPARTLASAAPGHIWQYYWVYLLAPTLGMLAAAQLHLFLRGPAAPGCAKLLHPQGIRCIHCGQRAIPEARRRWRGAGRNGATLNPSVEKGEIFSGVGQKLWIRRVIRALHRHDLGADLRVFSAQERQELVLGLGGSDDKNFPHAGQHLRDAIEKFNVVGRSVASVGTLADMGVFVLVVCLHDRLCLCVVGKIPYDSLIVIDPNDRMVGRHSSPQLTAGPNGFTNSRAEPQPQVRSARAPPGCWNSHDESIGRTYRSIPRYRVPLGYAEAAVKERPYAEYGHEMRLHRRRNRWVHHGRSFAAGRPIYTAGGIHSFRFRGNGSRIFHRACTARPLLQSGAQPGRGSRALLLHLPVSVRCRRGSLER